MNNFKPMLDQKTDSDFDQLYAAISRDWQKRGKSLQKRRWDKIHRSE